VRIYNPHEKKLDLSTISEYYRFYCPYHITRIVESRNAKFLENDLISESDQLRDLGFEIDCIKSQPSTSSERLFVIHTPQVQRDDEQHMIDIP